MTIEEMLVQATEAMQRGALPEAEALCRSVLAIAPKNFPATARLGEILLRAGRREEAIAAFEAATKLQPDHSQMFTGAAIMRFRATFGPPPRPRQSPPGTPRFQMTTLGFNGRFGNQLLQYAFVRLYAKEHGLVAELPQWIGRDLFDLDDPLPSARIAGLEEKNTDFFASLNRRDPKVYSETDVLGYFCGDTAQWGERREDFRALFKPCRKVAPILDAALQRLREAGKTLVAVHLRGGDFGYGKFWKAPPSWYLRWLRELWPQLDAPILYIAAEDRSQLADFAEFSPWDAQRLEAAIPGAGFLIDHHVLRNADYLAVSNSTFSITAAMLNECARAFLRPDPVRRELTPFDPWSSPVLLDVPESDGEIASSERALLQKMFANTDTVLHVGRFCAPWTNLARATHGRMMVHEIEAGDSVDSWQEKSPLPHIRHLVVEDVGRLSEILRGAESALRHARIGMVHFRLVEGFAAAGVAEHLAQRGYEIFRVNEGANADLVPFAGSLVPGRYVAAPRRVATISPQNPA